MQSSEEGSPELRARVLEAARHAVALLLIKVRILLDLQAIQNVAVALSGAIPQEIVELIPY